MPFSIMNIISTGFTKVKTTQSPNSDVTFKIDFAILPILCLIYMFCVIDRANIGYAKVIGRGRDDSLENSLKITSQQLNLCSSLVLFSYLLFEIPSNIIMKKINKVHHWICFLTIGFSLANLSQAFSMGFLSLSLSRLVLGMFEAGVFPAIIYYMNFWYIKTELAKRLSLYTLSSQLAGACSSFFVFCISFMHNFLGLPSWRWVFIVFSIPPFVFAISGFYILPETPTKCKLINEAERELLLQKLEENNLTNKLYSNIKTFDKHEFKVVFCSLRTYIYMFIFMLIYISIYSMNFSLPLLLSESQFSETHIFLLCPIPYLISAFLVFFAGCSSDKYSERGLHSATGIFIGILGFVIAIIENTKNDINAWVLFIAYNLIIVGTSIAIPIVLSWISNNSQGTTSTATSITLIIFSGNLGGFVGGNLYAGKNSSGMNTFNSHIINLCTLCISFCLCWYLKLHLKSKNRAIIMANNFDATEDSARKHLFML